MMRNYNPIKKIYDGEFSWKEDLKKTFNKKNLDIRVFELFAVTLGAGFF
jgi:hypothetical protein